ncbi:MAG: hypothetical protein DRJ51_07695 [Thermoprotei archaeon]|nr:MAG: hypothetical protein DRJ51_07695 [Thermoprotei archaeon]
MPPCGGALQNPTGGEVREIEIFRNPYIKLCSNDLRELGSMGEDWRFAGADTQYLTHGLHPYPARMIPQIARRLIERYSERKDVILDPFCGSGGVLVESMLLGRNSIGIDINPLALIIAKAKTTPLEPSELERLWLELREAIEEDVRGLRFDRLEVEVPKIPNLEYWFKP